MQDIRNCPRCGRVFVFGGREICPSCVAEEEEQFERVRRFLRESPGATLEEVAEATGAPVELILSFLRQGRLIATEGLKGVLACQRCGAPIDEGYLCPECSRELAREVGRAAGGGVPEEPAPDNSPARGENLPRGRMHVADLVKRRREQDDKYS
ncbi:MAG: MerR family transcriptional regulator [Bacillota bacterium]